MSKNNFQDDETPIGDITEKTNTDTSVETSDVTSLETSTYTNDIKEQSHKKFDDKIFVEKREFFNKINLARKEAIKVITKNAITKMVRSVKNGFNRTILYKYQWSPEPDAIYDPSGNRIIFGDGIRLSDLIRKGGKQFFRDLDDFFNKNGEKKYLTGVYPKKYDDVTIWNIYVSWNDEENYVK
jgi:hypothetical protein